MEVQILPNNSENDYFVYNNTKNQEISEIYQILNQHQNELINIDVFLNNDWLVNRNVVIKEKHNFEGLSEYSESEKLNFFIDTDIIILVIDSLMPITKSESHFLDICKKYDIPILVFLSKLDKTSSEEKIKIIEYVNINLEKINSGIVYANKIENLELKNLGETIISILDNYMLNKDFSNNRMDMLNRLFLTAYSNIRETVIYKLKDIKNKIEKIELGSSKKIEYINNFDLEWRKIELILVEKRQGIEKNLRSILLQNKNKVLQKLLYDLDHTNDVKSWWEKDLKYALERETQNILFTLNQYVNTKINGEINWLQNEVDRLFNYKISSSPRFEIIIEESPIFQKEISLSDNKKLKIVTRIGTAATVIAAGTLLMTSGIVGVAIAITTVGGITAEYLLNINNKKDKEKIKLELSQIVEKYLLDYTSTFSKDLKDTFDQIINELSLYRSNWKSNKSDEVSKINLHETSLVLEDTDWESVLKHIDLKMLELTK